MNTAQGLTNSNSVFLKVSGQRSSVGLKVIFLENHDIMTCGILDSVLVLIALIVTMICWNSPVSPTVDIDVHRSCVLQRAAATATEVNAPTVEAYVTYWSELTARPVSPLLSLPKRAHTRIGGILSVRDRERNC
uniref:Uncharacterized protein n=1 Tax=Glossina austeni TaxID=7395 RepID=A0A1A9VMK2_GLOAU